MAMAMATKAVAGARILSSVPTLSRSSTAASTSSSSSSKVAHLCSSFKGLSVQKWQTSSSRLGGDITGLSGISSAPSVSGGITTTRKLVFTVAKMKTHKATAKRFKVTGSGKIMRRHARKQHLLRKKSSNRKRRLSKMTQVNRSDYDNIIGALPYMKVKGRLT